ncbi:hypothetical protein JHL18_15305 [Clostridium sp. YIM B02505]|uniref:Cyclic lactone autoinducer peptide n=1 Tax=Clostridium yunnanense TaxID=2800325 RepID=A0ABS1ERG2_9CLOT|nr:hypothetical protein [Clostridium yunnanense]MBK1811988.1 hypothetical protein [Clostridium yunnanense]
MQITISRKRSIVEVLKSYLIKISNTNADTCLAIIFDEPEIPEALLLEYSKANN